MKVVLFDLGKTLEDNGVLRPGALDLLKAFDSARLEGRPVALLGLVSDFDMPDKPSDVQIIQQRYYELLDHLHIRPFFEPVAERVTLSTEVGVFKPDEAIFRAATTKIDSALEYDDVLFITENLDHVLAARRLGMAAVHLRGPGQPCGDVQTLPELIPLVQAFIEGDDAMETAVLDAQSMTSNPIMEGVASTGVRWTRLGDVLILRAPPTRVEQILAGSRAAKSARRSFVPEHRLRLVTQLARLFQEDHPDVSVVVDKGRYLVVDLDPDLPEPIEGPHASCYAVRPLPNDAPVFEQRNTQPQAMARGAEKASVPVDGLSRATFEEDLDTLTRLRTRHSTSPEFFGALEWASGRLSNLGYRTHVQTVTVGAGKSRNLIADRAGRNDKRDVVLVTAHLDSINKQGSTEAAPGADDNASGSAGVLAIGQALSDRPARHDLRLILFGGEEQGLFGSRQYVDGLDADERSRIRAVINMDMIACRNTSQAAVLLEGSTVSQTVIDALADIAAAHTSLAIQTSLNPFNSDHVPFLEHGIAAVLTIEGTDSANDRVHTEKDTIDTLDVDLALEILRMNVLFVARVLDGDIRLDGSDM